MRFMIVIVGDDEVYQRLPEHQQEAYLDQHRALQAKLRADGKYISAVRLMGPETAVSVAQQGGSVLVTDGPFAETKEQVLGFYLIEADDIEEAIAAAKQLPLDIARYEVRPVMWGGAGDDSH